MVARKQSAFGGYNMSTGVKAHVAGSCGCKAGWFERVLSASLMHGGTQTIRFWGLQHVHWCEGSCCWFLRLQSRLV